MIEVDQLTRQFGGFVAVDSLKFDVPKGQVLGFLGPNGAGKSTTMKMLTCFISPTSGTATINGHRIDRESQKVRASLGYLPESAPSYAEMTVQEFLTFCAEMRLLGSKKTTERLGVVKELCFLGDVWHQPIETLSKGYRQRVGFAQALVHDPQVLILDEPTDGLDPNQKHEVRQIIKRLGQQEKTVVLSTHILEEVEAVCDRAIIIAQGKIVADASPEKLSSQSRLHNAVTLTFANGLEDNTLVKLRELGAVSEVETLSTERRKLRVYPQSGQEILSPVSDLVKQNQWSLEEIFVEQGRLDEVFRKVTLGEGQTRRTHS